MTWNVTTDETFNDAILIEGLPGIGNVGKVVADLLVQEYDAETIANFTSPSITNAVLVRENNLVEFPQIDVQHFTHDDQDFLFLTGDIQPGEDVDSHAFAEAVADYATEQVTEIITLGGIGLKDMPDDVSAYCTANQKDIHERVAEAGANPNTYGKVGPIMGITGLLLATADEHDIPAAAILGETLAHPKYIGLKGSRAVVNVLNTYFDFGVDTDDLDDEIDDMEDQVKKSMSDFSTIQRAEEHPEMSYIG